MITSDQLAEFNAGKIVKMLPGQTKEGVGQAVVDATGLGMVAFLEHHGPTPEDEWVEFWNPDVQNPHMDGVL